MKALASADVITGPAVPLPAMADNVAARFARGVCPVLSIGREVVGVGGAPVAAEAPPIPSDIVADCIVRSKPKGLTIGAVQNLAPLACEDDTTLLIYLLSHTITLSPNGHTYKQRQSYSYNTRDCTWPECLTHVSAPSICYP